MEVGINFIKQSIYFVPLIVLDKINKYAWAISLTFLVIPNQRGTYKWNSYRICSCLVVFFESQEQNVSMETTLTTEEFFHLFFLHSIMLALT